MFDTSSLCTSFIIVFIARIIKMHRGSRVSLVFYMSNRPGREYGTSPEISKDRITMPEKHDEKFKIVLKDSKVPKTIVVAYPCFQPQTAFCT